MTHLPGDQHSWGCHLQAGTSLDSQKRVELTHPGHAPSSPCPWLLQDRKALRGLFWAASSMASLHSPGGVAGARAADSGSTVETPIWGVNKVQSRSRHCPFPGSLSCQEDLAMGGEEMCPPFPSCTPESGAFMSSFSIDTAPDSMGHGMQRAPSRLEVSRKAISSRRSSQGPPMLSTSRCRCYKFSKSPESPLPWTCPPCPAALGNILWPSTE